MGKKNAKGHNFKSEESKLLSYQLVMIKKAYQHAQPINFSKFTHIFFIIIFQNYPLFIKVC